MDQLYIIIPAYNEEENIQTVIEDWYQIVGHCGPDSRLVIVNDGSTDHTLEIVRRCAEDKPQLLALTKKNGGHGSSVLYGYRYAISRQADYIFQTDADGQTMSGEFAAFWQLRKQYDMVIGWRKNREDGFSRVIVTRMLKLLIRLCFGVSVTDANTPFRLMKTDTLRRYIHLVPKDFHLANVLISVIYAKRHCKVQYIPITFRPRQGGVNSINMKRIIRIGAKAVREFIVLNRNFNRREAEEAAGKRKRLHR